MGERIELMTIAAGIELPDAGIADICRRHQVRELSLFGSRANPIPKRVTDNVIGYHVHFQREMSAATRG